MSELDGKDMVRAAGLPSGYSLWVHRQSCTVNAEGVSNAVTKVVLTLSVGAETTAGSSGPVMDGLTAVTVVPVVLIVLIAGARRPEPMVILNVCAHGDDVAGVVNAAHDSPGPGWSLAGCYLVSAGRSIGIWYRGGRPHDVTSVKQVVSVGTHVASGDMCQAQSPILIRAPLAHLCACPCCCHRCCCRLCQL